MAVLVEFVLMLAVIMIVTDRIFRMGVYRRLCPRMRTPVVMSVRVGMNMLMVVGMAMGQVAVAMPVEVLVVMPMGVAVFMIMGLSCRCRTAKPQNDCNQQAENNNQQTSGKSSNAAALYGGILCAGINVLFRQNVFGTCVRSSE